MTIHEINLSDTRGGGASPTGAGTDAGSRFSGADVMGLLSQAPHLTAVRGHQDAAVSEFFAQLGGTDFVRANLVADNQAGKRPLKVEEKAAKFLKEELGVTEQYIEGDTVHFKL